MRSTRLVLALATLASLPALTSAGEPVKLPAKESFHLFVLAGQSNMAGRGKVADVDRKVHPRVLVLAKDGTWKPAVDPLHWDKSVAGVGPGKAFGLVLAEQNPDVTIGLIPTACGGSPISTWEPDGYHGQTKSHPWDDCVERTRRAMQDGTLKGVIWHQGESDSKAELASVYAEKLHAVVARFRKEFNAPRLIFVAGQMGQFEEQPWSDAKKTVDAAHQNLPKAVKHTGFVSSDGLKHKGDKVHFDAESARQLGQRYAKVYLALLHSSQVRHDLPTVPTR